MSLGKQMIERLRRLAAEEPEAAQTQSGGAGYTDLVVGDAGESARLEIFDHDRYSVSLRALEVGHAPPIEGDAHAYLSAHAAEIARRMSYLEEPLALWELDRGEKIAQLRSSPPQREGEEVSYWEVTLYAHAQPWASIMRYRWTPGMIEREVVAYPATFALVARMAESLTEALRTAGD